jgi:hypothetical protein
MASLSGLYADAASKANGFSGVRMDAHAISVAVGPAAANRGHEGKIVVTAEWYKPEAFGDDDGSASGFLLRPKSGHTRVLKEYVFDSIDGALAVLHERVEASRGYLTA